ncbi:hypothetical protein DRQ09_07470 [candidate division KSB1 bacterium]|nr:MAG: hypothetical protein DRQ09_07470 [candidate division KSB1 bacterium]
MSEKRGSILSGFFWMLFLSILLCWVPLIGQFIAGFVGGKKAGGVINAIIAFFLPAIVLTVLLIFLVPFFPLIGPLVGSAIVVTALVGNFGLFCGAIVGGALA